MIQRRAAHTGARPVREWYREGLLTQVLGLCVNDTEKSWNTGPSSVCKWYAHTGPSFVCERYREGLLTQVLALCVNDTEKGWDTKEAGKRAYNKSEANLNPLRALLVGAGWHESQALNPTPQAGSNQTSCWSRLGRALIRTRIVHNRDSKDDPHGAKEHSKFKAGCYRLEQRISLRPFLNWCREWDAACVFFLFSFLFFSFLFFSFLFFSFLFFSFLFFSFLFFSFLGRALIQTKFVKQWSTFKVDFFLCFPVRRSLLACFDWVHLG